MRTIILCYTAEVLCIWLLHTLEVAHVITVCVTNYWTLNSCNLNSMLVVSGWLILSGCLILSGWHVHFEPFLSPEKTWKWGQLTQRLLWQQVAIAASWEEVWCYFRLNLSLPKIHCQVSNWQYYGIPVQSRVWVAQWSSCLAYKQTLWA